MSQLTIEALTVAARIISAERIERARRKLTVTNLIIRTLLISISTSMVRKRSYVVAET